MKIDLSGKAFLVTGASKGIGKAIALALGACGAKVGIHYNSSQQEAIYIKKTLGDQAHLIQADLSQPHSTIQLAHQAIDLLGKIDGLVNNAGTAIESTIGQDTSTWIIDWEKTLQVNLTAPAILSKELIPHFQTNGGGKIVHVASRAAHRGDTAEYLAYAASKGGMVALSKSLARAYGKDNIVSFVVSPGFTRTEMAEQFIQKYGEDYASQDIALNELTKPEDISPTVVFLLSGMMDHATGTTIDINAGSYVR